MRVTFSASGTPGQVTAAIQQQSKAARAQHGPHAGPTISSVRDYLAAELSGIGAEETVTVTASVAVAISKSARTRASGRAPAAEAAEKE